MYFDSLLTSNDNKWLYGYNIITYIFVLRVGIFKLRFRFCRGIVYLVWIMNENN